jgi:hypothetical protein
VVAARVCSNLHWDMVFDVKVLSSGACCFMELNYNRLFSCDRAVASVKRLL